MKRIALALLALGMSAGAASADTYMVQKNEYRLQSGDNAFIGTLRVGEAFKAGAFDAYAEVGAGYQVLAGEGSVPVVAEVGVSKNLSKNMALGLSAETIYTPENGDVDVVLESFLLFDI